MSATVTELRPADQAPPFHYDSHDAKRARIDADAKAWRDKHTMIPGPLRAEIRARAILRGEGRPCSFVPARIAAQVATLAAAAADSELADRFQAWAPLDGYTPTPAMAALVDVLRPFASEPLTMLGNVAGAVAHLANDVDGGARRQVRAAGAELKRESREEKKRAAAAARAAKPARAVAKKRAPIVAPTPTEEESVTMTDETSAPETVETAQPVATIPQPLADYMGRLVHPAKIAYVNALVAHLYADGPVPVCDAEWAPKAEAKVRKLAAR